MIKRLCSHPSCKDYCVAGSFFCQKHKEESDKRKKDFMFRTAKRTNSSLYSTGAWKVLRKKLIEGVGHCEVCGASAEESGYPLEVHHILPPKGNPVLFFDADNLLVVCKICHARITAGEICRGKKEKDSVSEDIKIELNSEGDINE